MNNELTKQEKNLIKEIVCNAGKKFYDLFEDKDQVIVSVDRNVFNIMLFEGKYTYHFKARGSYMKKYNCFKTFNELFEELKLDVKRFIR
jgi:hypothetical protein